MFDRLETHFRIFDCFIVLYNKKRLLNMLCYYNSKKQEQTVEKTIDK